ncbi:hypothetical protein XANCAGTX0491_008615 [Xanthoria calcicola]
MAGILLEFDSDELAVLSNEGRWGSFRSALQDVEAIATARIYLPEGHATRLHLQGILRSFLVEMQTKYHDGRSPMLCTDQMRLITLVDYVKDLPQEKEQIKNNLREQLNTLRSSIAQETPRSSDAQDNLQSSITQVAPGCRDPEAHRGLLKTWLELDSNNADEKVVEEAVRIAFLSHSRPRRQGIAASEDRAEDPLLIPGDDKHQQRQQVQPLCIRVEKIQMVAGKTFKNAGLTLSHQPEKDILRLQVREQPPGESERGMDLQSKAQYILKYSTSKEQVALARICFQDYHILEVHLYSTTDGEILIERLKVLHVIECPDTLNIVQAKPALKLKLKPNDEAAGQDRVTPAKKRKT